MKIGNFVAAISTTSGAGNLTLAAMGTFRAPGTVFATGSANLFRYGLIHATISGQFEVGDGYMEDSVTLVRVSVIESSNSNEFVDFSAGIVNVFNDVDAKSQNPLSRAPLNVVTEAGPVTFLPTSAIITEIDQTEGAPMTINIDPATLPVGVPFTVIDGKGDAGTNNISLVLASGVWNLTGTNTYVMSNNAESIEFYSTGVNMRGM